MRDTILLRRLSSPATPLAVLILLVAVTAASVSSFALSESEEAREESTWTGAVPTGPSSSGEVDPTGAFAYAVPLKLPPGVNGFAPGFALSYNSSNTSPGIVGFGWSLSGISRIRRMPPAIAITDSASGDSGWAFNRGVVTWSGDDNWFLDGQLLVPCDERPQGANTGCPTGTYRTEYDDFRRVAVDTTLTTEPMFRVWSPNGDQFEYAQIDTGATSLHEVSEFAITRMLSHGNEITFEYSDDDEFRLEDVFYGGQATDAGMSNPNPACWWIEFVYETESARSFAFEQYPNGVPRKNSHRLHEVIVHARALPDSVSGWSEVRRYSLVYNLPDRLLIDAAAGDLGLVSIIEGPRDCEADGCATWEFSYDRIDPTSTAPAIGWQQPEGGYQGTLPIADYKSGLPHLGAQHGNEHTQYQVADFNRDGCADLVANQVNVDWLNSVVYFRPSYTNPTIAAMKGTVGGSLESWAAFHDVLETLNADISQRLGLENNSGGFFQYKQRFYPEVYLDDEHCEDEYLTTTDTNHEAYVDRGVRFADLNGDGFPDYVLANGDMVSDEDDTLRTAWDDTVQVGLWSPGQGKFDFAAGDSFRIALEQEGLVFHEYFLQEEVHVEERDYSLGCNYDYELIREYTGVPKYYPVPTGLQFVDLNGDRKADLVQAIRDDIYGGTAPDSVAVWLNTGSGFARAPSGVWEVPGKLFIRTRNGQGYAQTFPTGLEFCELNGDGLPDLIRASRVYYFSSSDPDSIGVYCEAWFNTGTNWVEAGAYGSSMKDPASLDSAVQLASAYKQDLTLVPVYRSQATGVRVVDINADGLDDLVRSYRSFDGTSTGFHAWADSGTYTREVYINAGPKTGFVPSEVDGDSLLPTTVMPPMVMSTRTDDGVDDWDRARWDYDTGWRIADFDGDGDRDILISYADYNVVDRNDMLPSHAADNPVKLSQIIEPLGQQVRVAYQQIVSQPDSTRPVFASVVVDSVQTYKMWVGYYGNFGSSQPAVTKYTFEGPQFDWIRGEPLGFRLTSLELRGDSYGAATSHITRWRINDAAATSRRGQIEREVVSEFVESGGYRLWSPTTFAASADTSTYRELRVLSVTRHAWAGSAGSRTAEFETFFDPPDTAISIAVEGQGTNWLRTRLVTEFADERLGRVAAKKVLGTSGTAARTTTRYGYAVAPDTVGWHLAAPDTVTVWNGEGDRLTQTSVFYDGNNTPSGSRTNWDLTTELKWGYVDGAYDASTLLYSAFRYTEAGNVAMRISAAADTTFTYWDSDFPEVLSSGMRLPIATLRSEVEHDSVGQVIATVDANGTRTDNAYDERGRLIHQRLRHPSSSLSADDHPETWIEYGGRFGTYVRTAQKAGQSAVGDSTLVRVTVSYLRPDGTSYQTVVRPGAMVWDAQDSVDRVQYKPGPFLLDRQHYNLRGGIATKFGTLVPGPASIAYQDSLLGEFMNSDDLDAAMSIAIEDGLELKYSEVPQYYGHSDVPIAQRFEYDAAGRQVKVTAPGGITAELEFTLRQDGGVPVLCSTTTTTSGASTQIMFHMYDEWGQLVRVTECKTGTCSNPDAISSNLTTTHYEYDERGSHLRTCMADGDGDCSSANSSKTRYFYDGLGRLVGVKDPDLTNCTDTDIDDINEGCAITYSYDNILGVVDGIVDARGWETSLTYDEAGRLKKQEVARSDSWTEITEWTYDSAGTGSGLYPYGRLGTAQRKVLDDLDVEQELVKRRYDYDEFGREITQVVDIDLGPSYSIESATTSKEYSPDSRVLESTHTYDSDSETREYEFDRIGRPIGMDAIVGQQSTAIVSGVEFDTPGHGLWTSMQLGSSLLTTRDYYFDAIYGDDLTTAGSGRLASLAGSNVAQTVTMAGLDYDYDALGRIDEIVEHGFVTGGLTTEYTYDGLNRLTSFTRNGRLLAEYEYSSLGNLKMQTSYDYSCLPGYEELWSGFGEDLPEFGGAVDSTSTGEGIEGGGLDVPLAGGGGGEDPCPIPVEYYRSFGEAYVDSLYGGSHAPLCEGLTTTPCTSPLRERRYDMAGNTTWMADSSDTMTIDYNGLGKIGAMSGSAVSARYVYGPGGVTVATVVDGVVTYVFNKALEVIDDDVRRYYFFGGQRIARTDGSGGHEFLMNDHLGSLVLVVDDASQKESQLRYNPWGMAAYLVGSDGGDKYKFNGRAEDVDGVYDYAARSYVPSWNTMLQADSVVPSYYRPQSLNRYAYVENAPTIYIDPTGHSAANGWQDFDSGWIQWTEGNTTWGGYIDFGVSTRGRMNMDFEGGVGSGSGGGIGTGVSDGKMARIDAAAAQAAEAAGANRRKNTQEWTVELRGRWGFHLYVRFVPTREGAPIQASAGPTPSLQGGFPWVSFGNIGVVVGSEAEVSGREGWNHLVNADTEAQSVVLCVATITTDAESLEGQLHGEEAAIEQHAYRIYLVNSNTSAVHIFEHTTGVEACGAALYYIGADTDYDFH